MAKISYVKFESSGEGLSVSDWVPGTHRNIREMLGELRSFVMQHHQEGHAVTVLAADNPGDRLWGFVAFFRVNDDEHQYMVSVSVHDYRRSLERDFTSVERDRLQPLLVSARGRQQMAQTILTRLPYEPG